MLRHLPLGWPNMGANTVHQHGDVGGGDAENTDRSLPALPRQVAAPRGPTKEVPPVLPASATLAPPLGSLAGPRRDRQPGTASRSLANGSLPGARPRERGEGRPRPSGARLPRSDRAPGKDEHEEEAQVIPLIPRDPSALRDPFPLGAPRAVDEHDLVESTTAGPALDASAQGFVRGVAVRDALPLLDAHWAWCRGERCSYVAALNLPSTSFSLVGLHVGPAHRRLDGDGLWAALKACEAQGVGAENWLTSRTVGPGVWWDSHVGLWIVARVSRGAAGGLASRLLNVYRTLPHDPSAVGREERWPMAEILAAFFTGHRSPL